MNMTRTDISERQHWMSVLAQAQSEKLLELSNAYIDAEMFDSIRPPETGLTQIRARAGGTGSQFNFGDMTFTRCMVRYRDDIFGHSYIAGRNKTQALRAAQMDALLQTREYKEELLRQVIEPLAETQQARQQARAEEAATTKVDFFTLVRGED